MRRLGGLVNPDPGINLHVGWEVNRLTTVQPRRSRLVSLRKFTGVVLVVYEDDGCGS